MFENGESVDSGVDLCGTESGDWGVFSDGQQLDVFACGFLGRNYILAAATRWKGGVLDLRVEWV